MEAFGKIKYISFQRCILISKFVEGYHNIGNNEKRQTLPVQYISSIYVSEEVAHYVTVSIISYKPIPIEYINIKNV